MDTGIHLVPVDCSREQAVLQLTHSFRSFQQTADQIFHQAAQRTAKCRDRMTQMGQRLAMLERKMDAMEEMRDVPLLHCAAKYPEVGTPGLHVPLFAPIGTATPFTVAGKSSIIGRVDDGGNSTANAQTIKEAYHRKQNPQLIFRRPRYAESALFNADKWAKLVQQEDNNAPSAELPKLELRPPSDGTTFGGGSAQIDFSESLLDLCPAEGPMRASERGMDPFAYEQAELSALLEFDLPEDLPGMDLRSISLRMPSEKSLIIGRGRDRSPASSTKSTTTTSATTRTKPMMVPKEATAAEKQQQQTDGRPKRVEEEEQREERREVLQSTIGANAPPPPPPPPPPPLIASSSAIPAESGVQSGDGRSDLMAAIRAAGGAGGAKLKRVEPKEQQRRPTETTSAAPKKEEQQPEDLMSSLAKALEMRRKGISGKGPSAVAPRKRAIEPLATLRERIPRARKGSDEQQQQQNSEEWN